MSMRDWLAPRLERLHHFLLPPTCLLCGAAGAAGRDLCAGCAADLPRNNHACTMCALPLSLDDQAGLCSQCCALPPDYDRAFAPFCYRPPLDFLIRRLKFNGRLSHARLLGELFADALVERGGPWPNCIIPVPLHPLRLRERGFNQALELARAAARRCQLPLMAEGLRRIRYTTPQTRLDARARQTNPLGAFVMERSMPGLRVALIDDVMTTASTVAECARILRAGGVADIEVWIIARAGGEP
jgi:ComF family protein